MIGFASSPSSQSFSEKDVPGESKPIFFDGDELAELFTKAAALKNLASSKSSPSPGFENEVDGVSNPLLLGVLGQVPRLA